MSTITDAAVALAALGWPVMPVKPGAKEPLTAHGVKDASTDPDTIRQWWRQWPAANLGVACGAPGPQVLDIDDMGRAERMLADLVATGAPYVATPRGRHFYFAGTGSGTVGLGYGELRGRGSYVVCPPSIHPSGREYVWLVTPDGVLPPAPGDVAADRKGKGAGVREPVERVPHGQRHEHLTDLAVRLVRSGVLEVDAIERALVAEYEAKCEREPVALPMYFRKLATWAAESDIATRERNRPADPAPVKRGKRKLSATPNRDAPLADLRAFVAEAAGLPDVIRVDEVVRFGNRLVDGLHIKLANGMRVVFDAQEEIGRPGRWRQAIIAATSGVANPPNLTGAELGDVLWALCVISTTTAEQRFEDDLQQLVDDLVELCEPVRGTFEELEPRYLLLGVLKERPVFDPRDGGLAKQPALVVDMRTGRRYLRASELMAFANHRKLGVANAAFAGRMRMIGVERRTIQGHGDTGHRRQVLYELPADEAPE